MLANQGAMDLTEKDCYDVALTNLSLPVVPEDLIAHRP
jgi:hypothetical protein